MSRMTRTFCALSAFFVAVTLAVAGPVAPASTAATAKTSYNSTYEAKIIVQINKRRTARDLKPVSAARCPDKKAEAWAKSLAAAGAFFHQNLTIVLADCDSTYAGEVLARGNATADEIVTAWMNSPSHRAVILSPKPRLIGVGAATGADGTRVISAVLSKR